MSEEKEPKTPVEDNVDGDGKTPDQEETASFTSEQQKQVDQIIKDRLARARLKTEKEYSDYAELKEKEKELNEIRDAQKTEAEKLQSKLDDEIKAREIAEANVEKTLINSAFIEAASKAGVKHPGDAFALADKTLIFIEEGKVKGVEEAVKLLVDDARLPLMAKPPAPNLDGGAGENSRSVDVTKLTPEQKDVASKMGVSLEDYAKNLTTKE